MKQERISLLENVNYSSWSIKTLSKLAKALDVAITVSFESFGTRIRDMDSFSRKSLERVSREDEILQSEKMEAKEISQGAPYVWLSGVRTPEKAIKGITQHAGLWSAEQPITSRFLPQRETNSGYKTPSRSTI